MHTKTNVRLERSLVKGGRLESLCSNSIDSLAGCGFDPQRQDGSLLVHGPELDRCVLHG